MTANYFKLTHSATVWAIIFACISINLPTTFMSVAYILIIIFWLLSGNYKSKINTIRANPGAIATLALLLVYITGVFYSSASLEESLKSLLKYQKLILIPLIISTLTEEKFQKYALNGFLISTVIVLSISYLKWVGVYPHMDTGQGFSVFKGRIAGSIIMSFGMYLMMYQASHTSGMKKYFWMILSSLAAINISLLVNGRTGQLLMLSLIIWFTIETWGWKTIKYWIGIFTLGFILYQSSISLPESRLTNIKQEIETHNETQQTSAGLRIEFYKNTITLIRNHPLFGGGTGSFTHEYPILAEQQNLTSINVGNPHNQFLLTTQELGFVGLIFLISFWLVHWKISYHLALPYHQYALRGLVLTIVIGSLFNSLLFDASEGKFYCILAGVLLSSYKKPNKI